MRITVGREMTYEFEQVTSMIAMLNVHGTRLECRPSATACMIISPSAKSIRG
jgi:hypothetical protein